MDNFLYRNKISIIIVVLISIALSVFTYSQFFPFTTKKDDKTGEVQGVVTEANTTSKTSVSYPVANKEVFKKTTNQVQVSTINPSPTIIQPNEPIVVNDKEFYANNLKSFYLTSSSNISSIAFQVEFADGEVTNFINANQSDGQYGDSNVSGSLNFSQIYSFDKEIKKVIVSSVSNGNVKFVENSEVSSAGILDTAYEYEKQYKERLFQELGFGIVTREEWGAPSYSLWYPWFSKINRIVVHHTATSVDSANPGNTVKAIYEEHKIRCSNNSGYYPTNCPDINDTWSDIGYNYLIDQYGNIYEGRAGGNGTIGAHAIPNSGAIGIALLGNFSSTAPTTAMLESLTKLSAALSTLNDFEVVWQQSLFGHRDYLNTECPGTQVYSILPQIAANIESYKVGNYRNLIAQRGFAEEFLQANQEVYVNGDVKFLISTADIDELMKLKLATRSWSGKFGGGSYRNDAIVFIEPDLAVTYMAEVLVAIPEAKFYVLDGSQL